MADLVTVGEVSADGEAVDVQAVAASIKDSVVRRMDMDKLRDR
ncbi:hypothetical protein NEISICOT_02800 [Neisseria sicca ATCC 29256]|uniref:Uncharacterized protein n=1 Tax=Neisseria sicca ATCC 29256 TaxID=547045 RepID=C6M8D1_NEISI|nr:hypothetical protein NEISICOT_02800 [Neisseria sicca ATCC 29256]